MDIKFVNSIKRKMISLRKEDPNYPKEKIITNVLNSNVGKQFEEITDYQIAFHELYRNHSKFNDSLGKYLDMLSDPYHYRQDISGGVGIMGRELRLPEDNNSEWQSLFETLISHLDESGPLLHLYIDGWEVKGYKIYYWDESGYNDIPFKWPAKSATRINKKSTNYIRDNLTYEQLIKIKKPFFKLKHGKLYDCKVKHDEGTDDTSIIPLAFQNGKNCQFIMSSARRLFNENPSFVHEIIKMDFDYIIYDGIRHDYPLDYGALTIACPTREDGTLLDYHNGVYFDFKETNEI